MIGWASLYAGHHAVSVLEQATDGFHRLGAGVLEAWSRALLSLSLARAVAPEAREAALQAEHLARYSGTPGARYFPYGISVDTSTPPNLFITDSFNHRIRKVAGSLITTVAGTGSQAYADGSAIAQAQFGR